MELRKIVLAAEVVATIMEQKMPAAAAYQLAKAADELSRIVEPFEKQKLSIIERHMTDEGISEEGDAEFKELLEVDVEDYPTLSVAMFRNVEVSPKQMQFLMPIIEE